MCAQELARYAHTNKGEAILELARKWEPGDIFFAVGVSRLLSHVQLYTVHRGERGGGSKVGMWARKMRLFGASDRRRQ